jgi:hypothetical protein
MGGGALAAEREVEVGLMEKDRWLALGLDPERKAVAGVGPASGRRSRASRAMGVDAGGDGSLRLRVEKTVESTAISEKKSCFG